MKKLFTVLLFLCIILTGCSSNTNNVTLEESEIKNICELSTLKIEFNNVIKCINEKDWKFLMFSGTFKPQAWAEYKGTVKVGIDMKEVEVDPSDDGKKITITLPKAKIIGEPIDNISEITEDFYHYSKNCVDHFMAKITDDDKQKALEEANNKMIEIVNQNPAILNQAQNRAKALIENYIKQCGEYEIEWILK